MTLKARDPMPQTRALQETLLDRRAESRESYHPVVLALLLRRLRIIGRLKVGKEKSSSELVVVRVERQIHSIG